jgi:hypothetical protein
MDPSGKASAAAISSRSGVSGVTFSGGGIEAMAQQHISILTHMMTLRSLLLGLVLEQQVVVAAEIELTTSNLF